MVKNLPAMQENQVQSLGQEDPLEKGMAITPVFLLRKPHGQRDLGATVHGVPRPTLSLYLIFKWGSTNLWDSLEMFHRYPYESEDEYSGII